MNTTTPQLTEKMAAALAGGYTVKGGDGLQLVNPDMHPNTLRALARLGLIGALTRLLTPAGLAARAEIRRAAEAAADKPQQSSAAVVSNYSDLTAPMRAAITDLHQSSCTSAGGATVGALRTRGLVADYAQNLHLTPAGRRAAMAIIAAQSTCADCDEPASEVTEEPTAEDYAQAARHLARDHGLGGSGRLTEVVSRKMRDIGPATERDEVISNGRAATPEQAREVVSARDEYITVRLPRDLVGAFNAAWDQAYTEASKIKAPPEERARRFSALRKTCADLGESTGLPLVAVRLLVLATSYAEDRVESWQKTAQNSRET